MIEWTLLLLALIAGILCIIAIASNVPVEKFCRLVAWAIICFVIRAIIHFVAIQQNLIR